MPRTVRLPLERFFDRDLSRIRVHDDAGTHSVAAALQAHAFAHGDDVYFARGRFDTSTTDGQRLLAHEITHTVQSPRDAGAPVRRQHEGATLPATEAADSAATTIVAAIRADNLDGVVAAMRGKTVADLRSIRTLVQTQADVALEHWLAGRLRSVESQRTRDSVLQIALGYRPSPDAVTAQRRTAASAEEGLRLIWPALPLIERMLVYNEGYRELEQAQIDVVRAASDDERRAARIDDRLQGIYDLMQPKEEYDTRLVMDSSLEARLTATERLLARGADDPLFDAILLLPPTERRNFVHLHEVELFSILHVWQLELVRAMSREIRLDGVRFGGNEVDALIARLRLATEGRSDDMEAVQLVVNRAAELLRERQIYQTLSRSEGLPADERARIDARLVELQGLDRLFAFEREPGTQGDLVAGTFMQLLSSARDDPDAFGADVQRFAPYARDARAARCFACEAAKQRVLMTGSDMNGLRATFLSIHAPAITPPAGASTAETARLQHEADVALRREVLRDQDVARVVAGLTGFERDNFEADAFGDEYTDIAMRLRQARFAFSPRWGEFFSLILQIARNDNWRSRLQTEIRTDPWGTASWVHGQERDIMLEILRTQRMPIGAVLRFTGSVEMLRDALGSIGERDRGQLRRGWALVNHPIIGPPTAEDQRAIDAYNQFIADLRESQTILTLDAAGYEAVLAAVLGTEPTAEELGSPRGLWEAAAMMYERQQGRLALDRGASQYFTETDETMVAAAREFAARWTQLRDRGELSPVDFAALYALHRQFLSRSEEFTEASNAIGEMAAMIASTVAGVVVVVATGGAATPGVIALAAAAGAGSRVVTREMFGADYFNSVSDEGLRQGMLGALDGALAVVSGRLAARGAELLGLSGGALTSGASRIAGVAAEEATQTLSRRVAAGAVESAIDGLLSGSLTEAFGTFTDERTWRRGIADGLLRVGQAALAGGLVGLGTGGVIGGVTPVLGAGAGRLWRGIVGESVDRTLARAGAADTLAAARAAAQRGELAEMNRLAAQLEAHLGPEQVAALRERLYGEMRQAIGRPPGTAAAASREQAILLNESGHLDDNLSPEQLRAETDVVSRSSPQPTTEPGYVREVDLGNGHRWRQQPDGTWCRFSNRTYCGTEIAGAAMIPLGSPSEIAAAQARTAREAATLQRRVDFIEGSEEMLQRLRNNPLSGARTINTAQLSDAERLTLAELMDIADGRFDDIDGIDNLTIGDINELLQGRPVRVEDPRGPEFGMTTRRERAAVRDLEERATTALASAQANERRLSQSLYDWMRARSPRSGAETAALNRATLDPATGRRYDMVSNAPPVFGALSVDHIVPLRSIVDMPGFAELARLDPDRALAEICDWGDNLQAMDRTINSSRRDTSWADPFPHREEYTLRQLQRMIDEENRLRPLIAQRIQEQLDIARQAAGRAGP